MPGGTVTIDDVDVTFFGQSAVHINGGTRVYVDVFEDVLTGNEPEGDLFLSTHAHWDHYDPTTINALAGESAAAVVHDASDTDPLEVDEVVTLESGGSVTVGGTEIDAVPAHNLVRMRSPGEPFHPEGEGMGLLFDVDGVRFYHPGDTDPLDAMAAVEADVFFVPIGGSYVMSAQDAYWALHMVRPSVAIPVHYAHLDGSRPDAEGFAEVVADVSDEIERDITPHVL